MSFPLFRAAAVGAAVALMLASAVPAAHAQTDDPPGEHQADSGVGSGTLVELISEVAQAGASTPEELSAELPLPETGEGSLTFGDSQRIVVNVMFSEEPGEAMLSDLRDIAEVDRVMPAYRTVTVQVDPARLKELEAISGVVSVTPVLQPLVGSVPRASEAASRGVASAAGAVGAVSGTGSLAATATASTACGPIPIEADSPLRSDEAREVFGVDGSGVTVGIISDSFDAATAAATDWADDVASGALPGPGNPCGRTAPVEVIDEGQSGSDEGRAMAQLVHGIAPGAKLLFASASSSGDVGMAANIDALVEAGADIIVDDISWSNELTYQQGFISYAIAQAREQGVAYFTSAGNSNAQGSQGASAGLPVSSWQTTAYRPTACPAWVLTGADDPLQGQTIDCLDFDPAAGVDTPYDTLYLAGDPGDGTIELKPTGSLGEPLLGATTDYEWRFYTVDPVSGDATILGTPLPRFSPVHPNFAGVVEAPTGSEVRMVLVRKGYDPTARLPAVYTFFMRGGGAILERAHLGDQVTDWVGEVPFGHAGDGSATSIASLYWDEPTKLREYSSIGPGTLLFEAVDPLGPVVPANRLSAPLIVDTPQLAAVDGTQTTFFAEDEGTPGAPEYRFYGTSAAAPNAAAVAALAQSYAPEIGQAELTDLMIGTAADDVINPFAPRFEDAHVFGAGRVDALALLNALPARPAAPVLSLAKATTSGLNVSWDAGTASRFVIELFEGGIAPEHAIEASQLPAGTNTYAFTGLKANTAYTVRLTPYGAQGVTGRSAELRMQTAAHTDGGGSGGKDDGKSDGTTGTKTGGRLSSTGAQDYTPWVVGGGLVIVLGAGVLVLGILRRKRADTMGE